MYENAPSEWIRLAQTWQENLGEFFDTPLVLCLLLLAFNSFRLKSLIRDPYTFRIPFHETLGILIGLSICLVSLFAGKFAGASEPWLALGGSAVGFLVYRNFAKPRLSGGRMALAGRAFFLVVVLLAVGIACLPQAKSWSAMPLMVLGYLRFSRCITDQYRHVYEANRDLGEKIQLLEAENHLNRLARDSVKRSDDRTQAQRHLSSQSFAGYGRTS